MNRTVIAFDFGASSGRAIKGVYDGVSLKYSEIHRFENIPVERDGHLRWDFDGILAEIHKAIDKCPEADSLAFDTWGVDYGLINKEGKLVSLPVNYRDGRGEKAFDTALKKISRKELYKKTGNQIMPINTLFQLTSDSETGDKLLFMPDLFTYALTGSLTTERTIASTSQMLDIKNACWSREVAEITEKSITLLPKITQTAAMAGEFNGIKVIKVAGHDTQCAIAAAPFGMGVESAFLSCGTWSLIGCELDAPVLSEKSMSNELSNELGANGKINYLKNISGLWLIQEARRAFRRNGLNYSYNDMEMLARNAEPFKCFIDPDAPQFSVSCDMSEQIGKYCRDTGQPVPQTDGEVIRCIYESLAMKYRFALAQISENTGKSFKALNLLGGGTKDGFLCSMTADSLGIPVIAGPAEATALGNIMLQLIALGDISDVEQGRDIIRNNENLTVYEPENADEWNEAYKKFSAAAL